MLHNEFSLVVAENTASCETKGRNGKTTNYFLHVFGLLVIAAKILFVFAEVWQFFIQSKKTDCRLERFFSSQPALLVLMKRRIRVGQSAADNPGHFTADSPL